MTTTAPERTPAKPQSTKEIMEKYPLLTAHLICESLGYFSPTAAANAILSHIQEQPFYCEWFIDAAGWNPQNVLDFGRRKLADAFHRRHSHRGYMAEIKQAKPLVHRETHTHLNTPVKLQSW